MPVDDYIIKDTGVTPNMYVTTYTSTTDFQEASSYVWCPVRTQAQCNTIATALNNAYGAGRFAVGPRPKP